MSAPLKRRNEIVPGSPPPVVTSSVNHHKSNGDNNTIGMNPPVEDKAREMERAERESLVLWRQPLKTLNYFIRELWINVITYAQT